MSDYFSHMGRTQVTKAQRDRLWAELKQPKLTPDDVAPGKLPPVSDPLATTIRAALDANALGMTVEEVAPAEAINLVAHPMGCRMCERVHDEPICTGNCE